MLDNINLIFDLIMDKSIGGSDYINDGRMVFGNESYSNEGKISFDSNMELYNYNLEKDSIFKKEEVEAFIIANDIKNKIESNYRIFDKDKKEVRLANYNDFVILVSTSKDFELFKKIFEYNNVPLSIEADTTIKEDIALVLLRQAFSNAVYENRTTVGFKNIYDAVRFTKAVYPDVIKKELVNFANIFKDELTKEGVVVDPENYLV